MCDLSRFIVPAVLFASIAIGCGSSPAAEVHVSPTGDDTAAGTAASPLATIAAARDHLRRLGPDKAGSTVWIHEGTYNLREPLELTEEDSGRDGEAVVYLAVEGQEVRLLGGRRIEPARFKPVTDPATLARIDDKLRGRIIELDLAALNIEHRRRYPEKFTDNGGLLELYVDNERMPLSRYPNEDYMRMKRVLVHGGGNTDAEWKAWYAKSKPMDSFAPAPGVFEYDDDRHERWVSALDRGVWFKGYWRTVWQNEAVRVADIDTENRIVTLAVPVDVGIGSKYRRPGGSGEEPYWVMNLLEEIDQPGEWAVDFVDEKLYLYPTGDLSKASIVIADMDQPVVKLDDASHVTLRGLTVEGGLGHGVEIKGGRNNMIAGCTIRNVTKYAAVLDGGRENTVRSSDLYSLGAGGVWLGGGDEEARPRKQAGHRVVNNHIHHFGQIERVYAPGVNVGFTGGGGGGHHPAVGMYVANNMIHDTPHAGVLFGSWDTVFEYNEIFRHCKVSNDMGGFYSYDTFPKTGNLTFRYNFIHSSPGGGDGIYFDCDHFDSRVYGNIVYLRSDSKKFGTGFLYKDGTDQNPRNILCYNNIAINCNVGYRFVAGDGSKIQNNVAINCKQPFRWETIVDGREISSSAGQLATGPNVAYEQDPGFVDMARMDFRLKPDSKVFEDLPDFEPVPVEKIGLFVDEYRTSLPSREGLGLAGPDEAVNAEILDRQ